MLMGCGTPNVPLLVYSFVLLCDSFLSIYGAPDLTKRIYPGGAGATSNVTSNSYSSPGTRPLLTRSRLTQLIFT